MVSLAWWTLVVTAILLSLLDVQSFRHRYEEADGRHSEVVHAWHATTSWQPDVNRTNILFYLYNLKCPKRPVKLTFDCMVGREPCNDKNDCYREKNKSTIFIIHGFMSSYRSEVNTLLKEAILNVSDVNVIAVDWSRYAKYTPYHLARAAVPEIGTILGGLLNIMIGKYKLDPLKFKLIGHNLGAHIAGKMGYIVGIIRDSIDYIVALDPNKMYDVETWLVRYSAKFVHVIHTNSLIFGMADAIGHADYYPNGGKKQPGCNYENRFQEILDDPVAYFANCSHSRAYQYYAESIRYGKFLARRCSSWGQFTSGMCKSNNTSHLPKIDVDRSASGIYYLDVNAQAPFSMGKRGIQRSYKTTPKRSIKKKRKTSIKKLNKAKN